MTSYAGQSSAEQWRSELAGWAIDPRILAAAPESPYTLPPELFTPAADPIDSPSRRRALEALRPGGFVLDVGCGAGAASLALVPPAAYVIGVDSAPAMLDAFAAEASRRGIDHTSVEGSWPEAEEATPDADVVVCHHVAYNVADLGPFALALGRHARRRVVLELTARHPWAAIGPLWRHFHGQGRPDGPSASLARSVLAEAGIEAYDEPFTAFQRLSSLEARTARMRRRLCLPPDRDAEIAALLAATPEHPRHNVTLWWDT